MVSPQARTQDDQLDNLSPQASNNHTRNHISAVPNVSSSWSVIRYLGGVRRCVRRTVIVTVCVMISLTICSLTEESVALDQAQEQASYPELVVPKPNSQKGNNSKTKISKKVYETAQLPFPKVLWVFTGLPLDAAPMIPSLVANNYISHSSDSGFDVRVTDNINAYEWLSASMVETIRKAKSGAKIDNGVSQLLKLALLIEHGGILLNDYRLMMLESVDVVAGQLGAQIKHSLENDDSSQDQRLEVCLLSQPSLNGGKGHGLDMIVAKPRSKLIQSIFEKVCEIYTTGQWPYQGIKSPLKVDQKTKALHFENLANSILKAKEKEEFASQLEFQKNYHIYTILRKGYMTVVPQSTLQEILYESREFVQEIYGDGSLLKGNFSTINKDLAQVLHPWKTTGELRQGSIVKEQLIKVEGNKWLVDKITSRININFCIVSLIPLTFKGYHDPVTQSVKNLKRQTYDKWTAVFMVNKYPKPYAEFMIGEKKVTIVNASQEQGLNLQRAVVNHCSTKDIVVLLDHDQEFAGSVGLSKLSEEFTDKRVFSGVVSLQVKDETMLAMEPQSRQLNTPAQNAYTRIRNHVRVFSSDVYRWMAGYSLHDINGRYYDRQIPLMAMLELNKRGACNTESHFYHMRKIETKMNIPIIVKTFQDIKIVTKEMKSIKFEDKSKLQYYTKFSSYSFCYGLSDYLVNRRTSTLDYVIFNKGAEAQGISARRLTSGYYPIPKLIHQVWVGDISKRPPSKQILNDRLKEYYPDFEYRLWTQADITRENFPATYDRIQAVLEFNKDSPFSKYSSITNLMRMEIVYKYGGFYFDQNILILQKGFFNKVLNYSLVLAGFQQGLQRSQRENSFFGAVKGYPPLGRMLDHRVLNTRDSYSQKSQLQTGPRFFSWIVEDESSPDVLHIPFEMMYPYMPYYKPQHKNLCEAPSGTAEADLLFEAKRAYLKDCDTRYPYAVAIDLFDEGGTWLKSKAET